MPRASIARPDPFATLNVEQRAAAEHGIGDACPGPLLVIAGAGTGKTMTLASRVAHLVLAGADPNRILLMTFSRRAAQEMERRAGRVLHAALGFAATHRAKHGDRHLYGSLTRFVPSEVQPLFAIEKASPQRTAAPVPDKAVVVDVGARVRGLF